MTYYEYNVIIIYFDIENISSHRSALKLLRKW
jgi:hypothetical protein